MDISSEEIVDSSQKSNKGNSRGRSLRPGTLRKTKARSQRQSTTKVPRKNVSQRRSLVALEVPESSTEENSVNISGSLFTGQQELLKHYQEHEENLKERDEVLETVLEQSRKAYELLKLQTEGSLLNTTGAQLNEVALSQNGTVRDIANAGPEINHRHFGVQTEQPTSHFHTIAVQVSPIRPERVFKDAVVQSSPDKMLIRPTTSTGSNTNTTSVTDAIAQTIRFETRDFGVQKYHSTRVREASVQVTIGELTRNVSKRNVCIQQRSSGMLELTSECALNLGLEMKCDPARLLRVMMRLAAKQSNRDNSLNSSAPVEFTEEDPYFANVEYFRGETVEDASVTWSDDGGIERKSTCCVEQFY
ncbi:uncharacterized protein LOC131688469 [Topomyia yanbarensis]|uniref:uncharacterized protein LOC131688469 n=1 Tax=Topomyia yanbarensis TaxID=2498891 RepID=UPI00273B1640|nr:uncharacterized protein LOC131688469 [Topomyia yanbarensis]